ARAARFLPQGNRLSQQVDYRRAVGKAGAGADQERLWAVPAQHAGQQGVLMKAKPLALPDVVLLEPKVFGDRRGSFFESYNHAQFEEAIGRHVEFVQDNHSRSARNVLRGLHYQIQHPQGKLVRVVSGEVFDVAVDLRKSSPTFGQWVGETLSAENKK